MLSIQSAPIVTTVGPSNYPNVRICGIITEIELLLWRLIMRIGICQCGCNQEIEAKDKGAIPKYLPGHGPATICACGCNGVVIQKYNKYTALFLPGHAARGRVPIWSIKPDSENARTAREQSRKLIDTSKCQMEYIGGCKGKIETHHVDKNPLNRDLNNLMAVCASHHKLLDNGTIAPDSKEMPKWYEGPDGKRRYEHTYPKISEWKRRVFRK